jgi:hypothetical protein
MNGKWMAQILWDAIVKGLQWMVTIKSTDDAQFSAWFACWSILAILFLRSVAPNILKNIKDRLL